MNVFKVWVTRTDGASRLRVDSLENTNWLLARLSAFFVFKTCEPLSNVANSSGYTFRVAYNSQLSGPWLEKVLRGISEVIMIVEPAQPPAAVH